LDPRRLLTAQVNVVGPQYLDVRVQAALVAASGVRELVAKTDALEALLRFLDPLAGGTDGGGWPFGRDVFVSELYALLEVLTGVDAPEGAPAQGLEQTIAALAVLFDPARTPEGFLPWLAGWAALSLETDWSVVQQRAFLSRVIPLYRRRGTRENLRELLRI